MWLHARASVPARPHMALVAQYSLKAPRLLLIAIRFWLHRGHLLLITDPSESKWKARHINTRIAPLNSTPSHVRLFVCSLYWHFRKLTSHLELPAIIIENRVKLQMQFVNRTTNP